MVLRKKPLDPQRKAELIAGLRRDRVAKEQSYRTQALKLFPHICGSCGREFSGRRLRELTVHHKDHNHDNNPPDGSNWELLCLYCHDNEHEKYLMKGHGGKAPPKQGPPPLANPFETLDNVFGKER